MSDELYGAPSSPNDFNIKGSIQISLVTSSIPDKRPYLIFSVNSGTIDMEVAEHFSFLKVCFGDLCSKGDFSYFYEMRSSVKGQYFTLDVDDIINCVVTEDDARSFTATAGNGKKQSKVYYCVNCLSCYSFFCCCGCCAVCGCCKCCECKDCCITNFSDSFTANDTLVVGSEAPKERENAFVANNVTWEIKTAGSQQISLLLSYMDPIQGVVRECKLKLAQKQTYKDAKRFAIMLQSTIRQKKVGTQGFPLGAPKSSTNTFTNWFKTSNTQQYQKLSTTELA